MSAVTRRRGALLVLLGAALGWYARIYHGHSCVEVGPAQECETWGEAIGQGALSLVVGGAIMSLIAAGSALLRTARGRRPALHALTAAWCSGTVVLGLLWTGFVIEVVW